MKHKDFYKETMRYIENARLQLAQAGKDGKFYNDEKYVHTACGTAYIGMLKALDILFDIKNIPKKRGRKSIEFYQNVLSGMDKTLLKHLNSAYRVLHLEGYYEGETKIQTIESGFDSAISIILALKPYSKNGTK
jgi:hypothetical protein